MTDDILPAAIGQADRSFPRLHPRPARGWVNDPNGIMRIGDRWHLFFQNNPDSARHDRICWGHMSSPDLLGWTEHPVALRPQGGGPDSAGCWSGVGVLEKGVPTAVYSGVRAPHAPLAEVLLARGTADAETWTQEGLVAAGIPEDPAVTAIRDPFLFELGGRRWALQGAGLTGGRGALLLYGAEDLEQWEYHGVFLEASDEVASRWPASDVWECPQLVRSGEDWVVLVSHLRYGEDPHVGVGSLVGSLAIDEGTGLPVFTPRSAGIIDDGVAFYAPQAVQSTGADGQGERVLVWGWVEELPAPGLPGRTQEESDAAGWSGAMSFPRELLVTDDIAWLAPARELTALRAEPCDAAALPDQAEVLLTGTGAARLLLAPHGEDGPAVWEGVLTPGEEVRVLVDASIIEVHRGGGPATTLRAYPAEGEAYRLEAEPTVSVRAWRLGLPV
ncbi:glycoside hydrolase family 32 protein [Brachybacterium hainanense]|uniref:beta-fructofuranosidase n=1 Tax=Brachybacterium hainanense TaxID=1541174 RepID=A0ABV6RDD1_9MICO